MEVEAGARLCFVMTCDLSVTKPFKFCRRHKKVHDSLLRRAKGLGNLAFLKSVRDMGRDPMQCDALFRKYEANAHALKPKSLFSLLSEAEVVDLTG